jgi:hypothetical protein
MRFNIATVFALIFSICLTGCGGGGGSNSQTARIIPEINASNALTNFFATTNSWSGLNSNDGSLYTASIYLTSEQMYPFVINGVATNPMVTKQIQLQIDDSATILRSQYFWKFHLDPTTLKPVGIAIGSTYSSPKFDHCIAATANNNLPTLTNSSGIYLTGDLSSNYFEGFRSGYAHYCDPGTYSNPVNVEWSVQDGTPNPYFCLTTPNTYPNPKTRICISSDKSGLLTNSVWIRMYNSDGVTPSVDFKSSGANNPI